MLKYLQASTRKHTYFYMCLNGCVGNTKLIYTYLGYLSSVFILYIDVDVVII